MLNKEFYQKATDAEAKVTRLKVEAFTTDEVIEDVVIYGTKAGPNKDPLIVEERPMTRSKAKRVK